MIFAIWLKKKAIFMERGGENHKIESSISLEQKESEVKYIILIKSTKSTKKVTSGEVVYIKYYIKHHHLS